MTFLDIGINEIIFTLDDFDEIEKLSSNKKRYLCL